MRGGRRAGAIAEAERPGLRSSPDGDEPIAPTRDAETPAFSGLEDERLFRELRGRMFARGQPLQIGRYRIERRLGAGAMGEVHLAVDEELDRPVAVKFIHAHLASRRGAELLRAEARALARVAHPNVVHVYEVGEHEGRIYLVMEYIEGRSLREWVSDPPRPGWEQVLSVYLEAGRGLAAAHRAGVIHRDFKPDNVLRHTDGRVAVVDFGLAALDHAGETRTELEAGASRRRAPRVSRSGELKGTPAYMPPEQFQGRSDARADQFSWCVSTFEGLWGRSPFPRWTLEDSLEGDADWEPLVPPHDRIPGWLGPLLCRGLEVEPDRRWDDLGALLAAIEARLGWRRRRWWLVGSGLVAAGVGLASGLGAARWDAESPGDRCTTLDRELETIWTADHRQRLGEAFASSAGGRPWLADSEPPVVAALDRWRIRWLESRRGLCEARVGGDPVVLDRHGRCLERHRRSTEALVTLLLRGAPEVLREAPVAVQHLEDPQRCAREASQGGPPEPPPPLIERVAELRRQDAGAGAALLTGRIDAARAQALELEAEAERLGYAPLVAEVALLHGRIELAAHRSASGFERLEGAADAAEAVRHDRVVAACWRHMAMFAATEAPDLEAGRRWLRRAEAASARVGLEPRTEARLEFIRGNLLRLAGELDASLEALGRAHAALQREGEPPGLPPAPPVATVMPVFIKQAHRGPGLEYLAEAVDSVVAQDFTAPIELIVVNDASEVDVGEFLLSRYRPLIGSIVTEGGEARYEAPVDGARRIRLIDKATNSGNDVAPRNLGILWALRRGVRYVGHIDSDDRWPAERVSASVAHLRGSGETDMLHGQHRCIDARGRAVTGTAIDGWFNFARKFTFGMDPRDPSNVGKSKRHGRSELELLMKDNWIHGGTVMYQSNVVLRVGPENMAPRRRYGADHDYWKMISRVATIDYLSRVLTEHRVHAGSMTQGGR